VRVLVTGGRGKVGSSAAEALRAAGHRVTTTDIGPVRYGPAPPGGLRYIRADLTDFGQSVAVVAQSRPDVVVHTAGIPGPMSDPDPVVFATNTLANYHVAEAVAQCRVARLVYISSETVPGFITATRPFLPDYLPVDEDHPVHPQDAYALSKALGEQICDSLVRRSDTTAVSIRPSFVLNQEDYVNVVPPLQGRPPARHMNHWSYVDVEDLADLIVLAAESTTPGHEVVYAAQPDNLMGLDLAELMRVALGDAAPPLRPVDRADASGISIAKARRLFGWDPKHSWRDRLGSGSQ
jgi:UDP-glucose 4-epimerase